MGEVIVPPRVPNPRLGTCSRDGLVCDLDKARKGCRFIKEGKWMGKCYFRVVGNPQIVGDRGTKN